MKKSKTREELLINTCRFYNLGNRAENETGTCMYVTPQGNRCAIGREVSEPKAWELKRRGGSVFGVFDLLPKRLQKMQKDFLGDIQYLHDDEDHWNNQGLSEVGLKRATKIINEYNLNVTKEDLLCKD